jgi:hypothetical protein
VRENNVLSEIDKMERGEHSAASHSGVQGVQSIRGKEADASPSQGIESSGSPAASAASH